MSLPLNGDLVRLGSTGDVIRADADLNSMCFALTSDEGTLRLKLNAQAGERVLHVEQAMPEGELASIASIMNHLSTLSHLSAVRGGSTEAFPMPDSGPNAFPDVGTDGRYASHLYHRTADDEVAPDRCHPAEPATTLRKQVDAWLSDLAPGAQANVQALPVTSMLALQFRLSATGEWRRPANVGYGLTYCFPILVALLAATPGQMLIIDSPEAHLHPQAQSRMGRMLATFAQAGLRIIVETHSDHVLNGVRLAVRDMQMEAANARVYFFAGASPNGHGVTSPRIDADGRIDEWPAGFFDQVDKDVGQLAGWA